MLEAAPAVDGAWADLWSKSGDQGNVWHSASGISALCGDSNSQCFVRLKGTRGSGNYGDIAVDSLIIHGGGCVECPITKYQGASASVSCLQCPSGYIASNIGSTECTACPLGTFARCHLWIMFMCGCLVSLCKRESFAFVLIVLPRWTAVCAAFSSCRGS